MVQCLIVISKPIKHHDFLHFTFTLKFEILREQKFDVLSYSIFFIVILTTASKVTSLHCYHQQLPASGDDHLQQVTTLQYCLVDDCTIIKIGEKLDIVYTTDSLIVTTPTDGHNSEVIAREKNDTCS